MDDQPNHSAALYQLVGPIESLYQLVPINRSRLGGDIHHHPLALRQPQHDAGQLVLFPFPNQQPTPPAPYFDDDGRDNHSHHHHFGYLEDTAAAEHNQFQLVPVGGAYELQLYNEELHQFAPPNELDGPIQLLAIEGPPQFPLVGPVPQLARIRCRFANNAARPVDLVWTDDNNRMYRYAKLAHEEFVDITTFEGHQWIFCDALDGELYLISPGLLRKFVATSTNATRGRRIHVSASKIENDLTLRKISLRILAQKLFDAWERVDGEQQIGQHRMAPPPTPINLLIHSMRLPVFIQIQLAQFVLSCILYQMRFECNQLSRSQQQIFRWLVNFLRSHARHMV